MSTFVIEESVAKKIDHWLAKYPSDQRRSALIPALLFVQAQNNGWLSEEAMDAVAHYIGVPAIEAYEVATFYDLYELKPIGRHKISVCTNVPCWLRGSDDIVACLEKRLHIKMGQTTADGHFTLREVECMAACANAPMCQIDDKKYHLDLTPEKMLAIIDALEKNLSQEAGKNA